MTKKTKNEEFDTSGLKVKINGHPNKVTGLRIVTDNEGQKWLQFGIEDDSTGHHQCIEFEVSGLANLWNHFTGFPDQVRSFVDGVSDVGKNITNRLEQAAKAFTNDEKPKE